MQKVVSIENFNFKGFGGTKSECSINLLFNNAESTSVVIACTQKTDYVGTSITNAFEIILRQLCEEGIEGKHGDLFKNILIKDDIQESSFFKKLLNITRKKKQKHYDILSLFDNDKLIWLEIYPEKTGIIEDRVTIQRVFLTEDGSPVWSNLINKDYIENELGLEYSKVLQHAI